MNSPLSGQKALIFAGDDYEDMELQYPRYRLLEAGAEVVTAGLEGGKSYYGKHGLEQKTDIAISDVDPADFNVLVIPGGWMPDWLRRFDEVKKVTKAMSDDGKCIAAICHGPWIPVSAGVVSGMQYTSSRGVKDDLINAGATWVDQPVSIDGNHVSSRHPGDLPDFCRGIISVLTVAAESVDH